MLSCCLCDFYAQSEQDLMKHLKVVHPREYVELYVCKGCQRWFKLKDDCLSHIKEAHAQIHGRNLILLEVIAWPYYTVSRRFKLQRLKY
jgi:uncharacterized C2H2 Zn-finger protein